MRPRLRHLFIVPFVLSLLVFLTGCEEDEVPPDVTIETFEVQVANNKLLVNTTFTSLENYDDVLRHGVVFNNKVVYLSEKLEQNFFSFERDSLFRYSEVQVSSFVVTSWDSVSSPTKTVTPELKPAQVELTSTELALDKVQLQGKISGAVERVKVFGFKINGTRTPVSLIQDSKFTHTLTASRYNVYNVTAYAVLYPASDSIFSATSKIELPNIPYTYTLLKTLDAPSRYGAFGFAGSNGIYYGSGADPYVFLGTARYALNDWYRYNSASDSWTKLNNLPDSTHSGTAFNLDGNGYIILGQTFLGANKSGYTNKLFQYQEATDSWIEKAAFPGTQRASMVSFQANGAAYVGLGGVANNTFNDFWKYDPVANTWLEVASFPGPVSSSAATSFNDAGYVVASSNGSSDLGLELWKYNPSANQWTLESTFQGRKTFSPALTSVDGKLIFIGGQCSCSTTQYDNEFWYYNDSNKTWLQMENIAFERGGYRVPVVAPGGTYLFNTARPDPRGGRATNITAKISLD